MFQSSVGHVRRRDRLAIIADRSNTIKPPSSRGRAFEGNINNCSMQVISNKGQDENIFESHHRLLISRRVYFTHKQHLTLLQVTRILKIMTKSTNFTNKCNSSENGFLSCNCAQERSGCVSFINFSQDSVAITRTHGGTLHHIPCISEANRAIEYFPRNRLDSHHIWMMTKATSITTTIICIITAILSSSRLSLCWNLSPEAVLSRVTSTVVMAG